MYAHIGDRLVVESPSTGVTRRDGEIVGLYHDDGTPPYDVRWSDTGDVTLVFPGPDAHVAQLGEPQRPMPQTTLTADRTHHGSLHGGDAGDVGRRLAAARRRKGLSVEAVAERARMAPGYLSYLETHTADPGSGTLMRLADALGTTYAALQGGGTDRPPGRGSALRDPHLLDLGEEECRGLLSSHGVGRIAFTSEHGPAVFPVNYEMTNGIVAFRTAPDSTTASAVDQQVAFEVDQVDDAMSQGWSVLVVGRCRAVTDPVEAERLDEAAHTRPWAGGRRIDWLAVDIERLTGRRITSAAES
ncbi:pyridoxamine 5'-phosphate oxidase family protein [Streptomyces enissocaesilis]|uniref:pyridoxamine 5'-phosphate oxidase family protein n=1 Tax=Streptomyces TaxID=1883 RepID=UPI000A3B9539|nr:MULTISPECIES: pyridoxamine 5'-phosphate oxidase family protein [Streptomyces]MDI3101597.1 pyridoxamine 5'-phosphate oxidase family protein [Streptomyces sp. AN-3]WDI16240.1 pyridoxamine 5'-phosphate oxidase family protein [Streptomyces enissocaesilis]